MGNFKSKLKLLILDYNQNHGITIVSIHIIYQPIKLGQINFFSTLSCTEIAWRKINANRNLKYYQNLS